jgi:integrase
VTDSSRSARRRKPDKPKKPYPDFPLTPHTSGTWQKKIRGKIHYFGRWARSVGGVLTRLPDDGWKEALEEYKVQADDLHAGRTPRVQTDGLTVKDLANHFLTAKQRQLESAELTDRTFLEYRATTDLVVSQFGLTRLVDDLAAPDFEALRATMARRLGPVRLGNEIQRVRALFKYGYEAGLIDKPMRYGPQFKKPSKTVLRKHRSTAGPKMFEAEELRRLIDGAGVQLRAMILLGINAGFGNADCAALPLSAVSVNREWITFPRPKTGVSRRCPLWPETAAALRAVIDERPDPGGYEAVELVFVTKYGRPWAKRNKGEAVAHEFAKLLRRLDLYRPGLGFYAIRHTFRTIADGTRDFPAVRLMMGHVDGSIDDVYRERTDDARLLAVAEYVRGWLYPPEPSNSPASPASAS